MAPRKQTTQKKAKEEPEAYEAIYHPKHYQSGSIEVIDIVDAFGLNFNLGNAVKYILRAGRKPGVEEDEDLLKAMWYLRRQVGKE